MAELSAMYGTRLFDQPEHAARRDELRAFLAGPGPLAVEIGFDHGMCILDRARRFPDTRQLGVELREARVEAARPHAPPNCLLTRIDGRTLVSALLPDASVSWVYILFPTPPSGPKRALLTPGFAAALERVLAPGGVVWLRTDVPALADVARACLPWPAADPPPLGEELSRRERVCRRDAIPVHTWCVRRPGPGAP